MAGDVAALLMLPHAPLSGQVGTRWTLLLTVAVVEHWVITFMLPGTWVFTLWGLGAARDGREQDTGTTVARKLIKTGLPAGLAVPTVTQLLAAMEATREHVATDQRALVLEGHATQLVTFMSSTGPLLRTALLTGKHKLIFIVNGGTRNLLGLGAASTPDSGGEAAGSTAALVAQLLTQVDGVIGPAGQRLVAGPATGGYGVGARVALRVAQLQELGEHRLPAGTAPHQPGGAWAGLAWPSVAHLLAPVGSALQHLPARFLTGEVSRAIEALLVRPTEHLAGDHSAVASLLDLELARLAPSAVAHLGTRVLGTVQHGSARGGTLHGGGLSTAHGLARSSTYARLVYEGRTLGTRSRVTQNVTGMVAVRPAPLLSANVSTTVGDLCALPLRIGHFATEACVGVGWLEHYVLTGRTTPAFGRIIGLRGR